MPIAGRPLDMTDEHQQHLCDDDDNMEDVEDNLDDTFALPLKENSGSLYTHSNNFPDLEEDALCKRLKTLSTIPSSSTKLRTLSNSNSDANPIPSNSEISINTSDAASRSGTLPHNSSLRLTSMSSRSESNSRSGAALSASISSFRLAGSDVYSDWSAATATDDNEEEYDGLSVQRRHIRRESTSYPNAVSLLNIEAKVTAKLFRPEDLRSDEELTDVITLESSINDFKTLLRKLVERSDRHSIPTADLEPFIMRGQPTLSTEEFIDRIQDKCKFPREVYLAAMLLLELVALKRDESTQELLIRRPIAPNQTHRLVIALTRIANKLIEDTIHRHHTFSRITGVSPKLLSKLEIGLLRIVLGESLTLTCAKMVASLQILKDL